jgi:hypothetical protein
MRSFLLIVKYLDEYLAHQREQETKWLSVLEEHENSSDENPKNRA